MLTLLKSKDKKMKKRKNSLIEQKVRLVPKKIRRIKYQNWMLEKNKVEFSKSFK